MRIPTIHAGGTPKDLLYGQLRDAVDVLTAALHAMRQAAPVARDYAPQGAGAFEAAEREHLERVQRVESAALELVQIARAIGEP
jgi:hypothetical protein